MYKYYNIKLVELQHRKSRVGLSLAHSAFWLASIIEFDSAYCVGVLKATPHKDRLTALWHTCLHIFRHLAHKFLDIRQYACEIYTQSAEKSDCASAPQSLCGVALMDI